MNHSIYSIILLFFFISCGADKSQIENNQTDDNLIVLTKDQWESEGYELVSPSIKPFADIIRVTGEVDVPPKNRVDINVMMEGYIKSINLLEGDYVKKGQLLFLLENPKFLEIQQQFLELHEQLTFLESEYKRYKKLQDEKVVSEKVFLKAESDYKTANAKYKGLQEQIKQLSISIKNLKEGNFTSTVNVYAPISGYVSSLKANKGMFISASSTALEIIGNDHLHGEFYVYENDVWKLNEGQDVTIRVQSNRNKKLRGKIHLIGKSLDENRRVKVHVHFTDSTDGLIMGMYLEADIRADEYVSMSIPTSAAVKVDNNLFGLKYIGSKGGSYQFKKIVIETGANNEEYVELKDEALKNHQFLKNGVFYLVD